MYGGAAKPQDVVVGGWLPPYVRWIVPGLAVLFLLVLGTSTSGWQQTMVPHTLRFFTQMACLFPDAAPDAIEYRMEGWSCAEHKWKELDYRPYFPLRPDDKENRFQRLGHFYRRDDEVMHLLERWIEDRHNGTAPVDDGFAGKLGGIRFMSLRIPVPPVGEHLERYHYKKLDEYPTKWRKYWYPEHAQAAKPECTE